MDDRIMKAVGRQFMEMSLQNDNVLTALEEARNIVANLQNLLLKCECECNAEAVNELKNALQPPKLEVVKPQPKTNTKRK
jgi:hypothetical protein